MKNVKTNVPKVSTCPQVTRVSSKGIKMLIIGGGSVG